MGDNKARDQQKEAIKGLPSLSLSATTTSPPSRKRLLADLKPKQGLAAASVSADSLSDRFPKKTREFPNLSNCHGCGLRINYSNPKERLQTLDSLWRIVLLCKKCFKLVESAKICSYCFGRTCDVGCFRCTGCKRCIHKDCVVKFGRFPPWSYCCLETRFLHCVDCWVPKLLVKSTRVYRRRRKNVNKSIQEPGSVSDSRVSVNSNKPKILHDTLKDANYLLEKKIVVAAKAKENALSKALLAKSAVEIANSAVELAAKKDENHGSCSSDATTNAELDDADLAYQLHRAINSSPRISKNECVLNSSSLSILVKSSEYRAVEVCTNDKLNERIERTLSEPSICLRVSDFNSSAEFSNLIGGEATDNRVSTNNNRQNMRNQEVHSKESITQGSQKCTGNSNMIHINGDYNRKPDRYLLKYSKRTDRNRAILHVRSCNRKPDRYLLKYKKRRVKSKADSNTETKFCDDSLHLENKDSEQKLDRYLLKYSKKAVSSKQFRSCAVPAQ